MNLKRKIKSLVGFIYYNCYYKYARSKGNRVLIYHAFGTKLKHDTYGISIDPELFEKHIVFLKENYTILPICHDTYDNKLDVDSVSISIDDGYKDNLVAVRLLEKYNIPYTIYVSTGFIDKEQYLSKDDLKHMSKSPLCTIGTHSVNHVSLSGISKEDQYKELYESKSVLEEIIKKEVINFSYPYGDYDNSSKEMADSLYEIISTSHIGINSVNQDKKMLKRVEIIASDNVTSLKNKVNGYYDYLGLIRR